MRQDKRNLLECLGALLLLVVFLLSFASVVHAFDDVVKTVVSRHDEGDHYSFPVGVNLINENSNREKRAILTTALAVGEVAIALTDFVTGNVRQSFDNSGDDKNHQEIVAHFEQIQMELEQQTEELQSINQEIQKLGLSLTYFEHEDKIKDSLFAWREYLRHPNQRNLNRFTEKAVHLDQSIRILVDGLLGQHTFRHDIMAVMRDAAKCHGRKLRKSVRSVGSLIMTGLYVGAQYQRMMNETEGDSSPFKKYIGASLPKLKTKLDEMVIECQADETNVSDEMRKIMKAAALTDDRQTVADSLLEFLEDKYDTKWIVFVENKSWENSVRTAGFHQASVRNDAAFAISVDRRVWMNFSELRNSIDIFWEKFNILTWCWFGRYCICPSSVEIEKYLNRFLIPLRTQIGIEMETLVFADEVGWQNSIVAISEDLLTNNNNPNKTNSNEKVKCYYQAIVIPTKPVISASNPSPSPSPLRNQIQCSYDFDRAKQDYGPLRNERTQAYLSVQGDSREEGASVILDQKWRNSPGQRWKFVDGQLRNGIGKCLTFLWYNIFGSFHKLYQYNCDYNWPEQKWDRYGLLIVNNKVHSLGFDTKRNQDTIFVYRVDGFDLSPSYIWYNRNTDCEDALVIPSTVNGSRPLRNEFSRFFLDLVDNYGTEQPWSNRPRQLWQFVDGGLLRNDEGKCLAGSGWYVQPVDCAAGQIGNNGRWTYTENRQIKSKDGYCLSSGDANGYLYYDYCRDKPRQRWWYFS